MPRSLSRILAAPFQIQHYKSLVRSRVYVDRGEFFVNRYVMGRGDYPYVCRLRTPQGQVNLTTYRHDDCFTIHEIFAMECYRARSESVYVDFGSNIGISAAYFLSRNPNAFVYCFEPLPRNIEKLQANLDQFGQRFSLTRKAVSSTDGQISFHVEPTGRYSGIDNHAGELCTFDCVSANRVLEEVIAKHGRVDLLKIDVEGAERLFFPTHSPKVLEHTSTIYIEGPTRFSPEGFRIDAPVPGVDRYRRHGLS